jgi:hypothetical protein
MRWPGVRVSDDRESGHHFGLSRNEGEGMTAILRFQPADLL